MNFLAHYELRNFVLLHTDCMIVPGSANDEPAIGMQCGCR